MSIFIEAKKISYKYDQTIGNYALNDIDFSVREGEFIAILGRNGCGKSTLAKHLNGIIIPTKGDIYINGINTKDEDRLYEIRQNIGMVFQNPDNQLVATVVEEDVAFGLENLGIHPDEIRERVDCALRTVNMYDCRQRSPHQLSGGQKQRVAIAGIIAMRPKCIVLDEPTAMLDPQGRREVIKTILELNENHGITVVLITHYMDEAVNADKIFIMDAGRIVKEGTPKEVFSDIDCIKSAGLDVPQVTELCHRLSKKGIPIQNDIITEKECVDALYRLLEE